LIWDFLGPPFSGTLSSWESKTKFVKDWVPITEQEYTWDYYYKRASGRMEIDFLSGATLSPSSSTGKGGLTDYAKFSMTRTTQFPSSRLHRRVGVVEE